MESSDEEIEGGTEGVAVFSRSDHLLSLGFHDSPLSVTNGTEDKEWERPKQELGNKSSYTGSYKDGLGECEHTSAKVLKYMYIPLHLQLQDRALVELRLMFLELR